MCKCNRQPCESLGCLLKEALDKPTGHPHALLMAEYAKDALTSKNPWEGWQYGRKGKELWYMVTEHPAWDESCDYRRKPKIILINGIEVPEPLRVAPKEDTEVYPVSVQSENIMDTRYINSGWHLYCLKAGILHATKEAAELHAKALRSFTELK